jgi:hypothetical protein
MTPRTAWGALVALLFAVSLGTTAHAIIPPADLDMHCHVSTANSSPKWAECHSDPLGHLGQEAIAPSEEWLNDYCRNLGPYLFAVADLTAIEGEAHIDDVVQGWFACGPIVCCEPADLTLPALASPPPALKD